MFCTLFHSVHVSSKFPCIFNTSPHLMLKMRSVHMVQMPEPFSPPDTKIFRQGNPINDVNDEIINIDSTNITYM